MAVLDTSDYRASTYGAPTHYCDPAATSNGSGTLGSPWTTAQAMANAVAGNVVGFLPGVSVIHAHSTDVQTPTLNPANSGTSGSRIVFVTKYAAVALDNVASNGNRTQLRHDGTGVVADGPSSESGTGASMYGSADRDYITWDGFYVDCASAEIASDTGVISVRECTGVHIRNFYIKGKANTCNSNAVLYRPNNCVGTVLSNFIAVDHSNDGSGGSTPQEGLFSDQYGDEDFTIEYGTVRNCETGFYTKGSAASGAALNWGVIRYNVISGANQGMRFNAWDTVDVLEVHHNLIYDYVSQGMTIGTNHPTAENMLIHHNTIANGTALGGGANGGIYIKAQVTAFSNFIIRDNIIDWVHASAGKAVEGGEYAGATFPTMNYNRYYRAGNTVQWSRNGSDYSSIAAWRTATSQEANSDVFASEPFNSRATDDYTIASGHAALTASSTGGQVGAFEGGETPGAYGSYAASSARGAAPVFMVAMF